MKKHCDRCGKKFVAKRKSARFCSDACRVAYNRGSGSLLREHFLEAIYHLMMMESYLNVNPSWQVDPDIIDIARNIQQFASAIDNHYEEGVRLQRNDKKLIADKIWTQSDKDKFANHLLSYSSVYKCLSKDCGQLHMGKPMPNEICEFCGKSFGWLKQGIGS